MIVITTPTGNIGRQVLKTVLAAGAPVRVIVRDPSRLPADLRPQVEIVEGSHGDPAVVDRAFAGADAVFWLVPADKTAPTVRAAYVDFARPACEAFTRHGVRRVVSISALGRGFPGDAGHVTATLAMDDLITGTGVAYRAVTCPSFMDNLLRQAASIRDQGTFSSPTPGDRKVPTCAIRDITTVSTRLLLDSTWTGSASVPVLGPEDLSFDDMARILSEVLGKPIRFQRTPDEIFVSSLRKFGHSEAMAQALLAMASAKSRGLDNVEPRTAVATTPTSFRQWCQEVLRPAVLG